MSNSGLSVKDEAIREVAFGGLNASLTALGSTLSHDAFTVSIFNTTDQDIYISVDGSTNQKRVPAGIGRVWDYKTNDMFRKSGTQFYVAYASAPASGNVWIEVEYA